MIFKDVTKQYNTEELRKVAEQRLPKVVFDYLDGGAEDEITIRRNRSAFNNYQLRPRALVDVSSVSIATSVMGTPIGMPLLLSPTGMTQLFHHSGECAVARAAEDAGVIYALSSLANTSIEDVAAVGTGPKWFQIYMWRDRGLVREFIARCQAADYKALVLTVDTQVGGNRERDRRNGFSLPPKLSLTSILNIGTHPSWWLPKVFNPAISFANVAGRIPTGTKNFANLLEYVDSQFDMTVTWDDLAMMIELWDGAFAIKGIMTAEDAKRAVEVGATGIMISNHGGRQLDHTPAPIDMLPEISAAVNGRAELIVDGGVRRGTDIIKALAMGAKACSIGRPYLFGLAAGGQTGVKRVLEIFREELVRDMRLLGCPSTSQLDGSYVASNRSI
jgi:L-lactate dehydrogenase (cytochrome)